MNMTMIPLPLPPVPLPITTQEQLRAVIVYDRAQKFQADKTSLMLSLQSCIDFHFETATQLYAKLQGSKTVDESIRNATRLHLLWSYVDGLLHGKSDGALTPAEEAVFRSQWNNRCDLSFGNLVGQTLKIQQP